MKLLFKIGCGLLLAFVILCASGVAPSAYNIVQNAGTPLPQRTTLNMTGAGVSCADSGGITVCTVTGLGATGAGTVSYNQTFTSQTSVTLADAAGTTNKLVQCFDNSTPPNYIIPASIALTSTTSTTVTFSSAQSGSCTVIWSSASGALFRQTASVTVANTTTETTLTGAGVGSLTLPANFFNPGTTIAVRVFGYHSAVATLPTVDLKVKIGGVIVLDTGAVLTGAGTNDLFSIDGWITCRTTGATGTVFSQGWYNERAPTGANSVAYPMVNTAATTINTTTSNLVDVTLTWGTASASDTMTATNLVVSSTGP